MFANVFISVQSKLNKAIKKYQLWHLPDDWTETAKMTEKELAEEARSQTHLLRSSGVFASAVTNPFLANKQFLRFCEYTGMIYTRPYIFCYIMPLIFAMLFLFISYSNIISTHPTLISQSPGPSTEVFVMLTSVMMGIFAGVWIGILTMAITQFKNAYTPALLL